MSKTDTWLPLYVADYLTATTRLTTEQHGAYLLIIMDYWRNGPPPDDDAVLARITGLALARWRSQRMVIQAFFQISGKCWQHKRINAELERANRIAKSRQEAGKRGGEAKANSVANGLANAKQKATPSQSHTPSQEKEKEKSKTFAPQAVLTDVEPQLVEDWLKVRKEKKAATTETAINGVRREATKAGLSMQEAVRLCCENSWAGFKASWPRDGNGSGKPQRTLAEALAEDEKREVGHAAVAP